MASRRWDAEPTIYCIQVKSAPGWSILPVATICLVFVFCQCPRRPAELRPCPPFPSRSDFRAAQRAILLRRVATRATG